jgi:hypothetical protein
MVARGGLTIRDSNNKNIAFYRSNGTWIRGGYYVRDNDDKNIAWFSSTGAATRGGISVRNSSNRVLVNMTTATTGAGFFKTLRTNGSGLVELNSTGSGSSERGHMALYNASNKQVVKAFANDSGHGVMGVLKSDGNWAHWLDASGSKNFVMAHPTDSSKNIVYAAIEGPEAAAYCRGRAKLEEGKAYVEYSDHFALVVNPDTITIQLTPRAASSKGLAVTNITEAGFDVRELARGKGKYEFDYLIMGVRKDLEHYEPVVNKGFTAFGEYIGDATSDEDAVLASANEEKADFVSKQEDDAVFTDAQIAESDVAEPRIVEPNEIPDLPDASSTTSDLSDFPARLRPDISKPPRLNPAE